MICQCSPGLTRQLRWWRIATVVETTPSLSTIRGSPSGNAWRAEGSSGSAIGTSVDVAARVERPTPVVATLCRRSGVRQRTVAALMPWQTARSPGFHQNG
ncbi:hypothetical protein KCP75_02920 [Salmonella enterica subsp. enterica]|nr:hypothetical protein KCP75_02920 [Salmonella enterica subsp. enterica]